MDFGFSEEQEMLRKLAHDFLAKESPIAYVRRMMEDDLGYSVELWRKMAELGWLGLIFPQDVGGAGLDMVDLAVVLEEMGRVVMPGPFFSTVLLGGVCLLEGADEAQKARYLKPLVAGELKATLAVLESSARWDAEGIAATATADAGGFLLNGIKRFAPDAHVADLILVAARTDTSKGGRGSRSSPWTFPKRASPSRSSRPWIRRESSAR